MKCNARSCRRRTRVFTVRHCIYRALGGRPECAAFDGHGAMYVNLEDKSAVQKFDPAPLIVRATR